RVIGLRHQCLNAKRISTDQHGPKIDMQGGDIGLDRTGEHRPRGCIAPASNTGIGLEPEDGVLHRACDIARTMAAHQPHRDVGDIDRHRRDFNLLQTESPPRFPGTSLLCGPQIGGMNMAMRRNLLRERLNAGKPTVGTHILSAWPTLVELIGHSKLYDYVEF